MNHMIDVVAIIARTYFSRKKNKFFFRFSHCQIWNLINQFQICINWNRQINQSISIAANWNIEIKQSITNLVMAPMNDKLIWKGHKGHMNITYSKFYDYHSSVIITHYQLHGHHWSILTIDCLNVLFPNDNNFVQLIFHSNFYFNLIFYFFFEIVVSSMIMADEEVHWGARMTWWY